MIRFALACILLGGSLLLASPSAADHFGPVTTKDQARAEIYDRIMTSTSFDTLSRRHKDWTKPGKRLSSTYSSAEESKTLAVCINWNASNHDSIVYSSWWYNYNYRSKHESKRNAVLKCKLTYEKKHGCTCEAVDQDDENVLKVPDNFLVRYMGSEPSARPGKFDGNWGGAMACGTCSGCPGPLQKPVTITVANNEFDFAPDTSYLGVGNIDSQGNVEIRWTPVETYMGTTQSRNLWFEGKITGDEIELHGERGPRECTVTLSRVNP